MRIRLLTEDPAYREAFMRFAGKADQDIYMAVDEDAAAGEEEILVTDHCPGECVKAWTARYQGGIIFLDERCQTPEIGDSGPFRLFKYERISELMAQIRLCYAIHRGERNFGRGRGKRMAIFGEHAEDTGAFAEAIARQIIYHCGGRVLILPRYFLCRGHSAAAGGEERNRSSFQRLMHLACTGRPFPPESFFTEDEYGIHRLRTLPLINPLPTLDVQSSRKLDQALNAVGFDAILYDMADCYTEANRDLLRQVDLRVCISDQLERMTALWAALDPEQTLELPHMQLLREQEDRAMAADDFVRKVYGI